MGDNEKIERDFVHLARLALSDRQDDVLALVRRASHYLSRTNPGLAAELKEAISGVTQGGAVRAVGGFPLPVDADSRLELLRREMQVVLDIEPVWAPAVAEQLAAVVAERAQEEALAAAGLTPTRSLLFTGAPGVGKTLAARWLAASVGRPLLTLDLAAVMSSFLGRTGNNIRSVLDYARRSPCVLLLDEFDAIAKRRDDVAEIGELKRLVTVLLQTVDDWPAEGILVAATNHPELLDPAAWRRFERVVEFPKPDIDATAQAIGLYMGDDADVAQSWLIPLALVFQGASFSEVEKEVKAARRNALVHGVPLDAAFEALVHRALRADSKKQRLDVADALVKRGVSQRRASELTAVSRDTMRKRKGTAPASPAL